VGLNTCYYIPISSSSFPQLERSRLSPLVGDTGNGEESAQKQKKIAMSLHRASHVRRCSSAALGLMALRTAHSLAAPPGSALATKLFYNDVYTVELPAGHKFPMEKYGAVRRKLQRLLGPGRLATFHESPLASRGDLGLAHCPTYVERYLNGSFTARENRVVGFPWSPASVNRALSSVGGTVAATHAVCRGECGIGGHLAGGTHHAFRDRGEGG